LVDSKKTIIALSLDEKFSSTIYRFSASLSDLRDFSELVESLIKKHKLQELETALVRYRGLGDALCLLDKRLQSDIGSILNVDANDSESSESGLKFKVDDYGDGKKSLSVDGNADDIKVFDKSLGAILKTENSVNHLHRSSLISLVSVVETFLSQLLHLFFQKHPTALNAKEKQFTFEELSNFSSINDARDFLVSWKIENLLRGSYEDWVDYFKSQFKLELCGFTKHHDDLVENFQRRNLFVHNDGVVNKIYLSKVAKALIKPELLGKKLGVSRGYLIATIDRIESSFLQLAFELWAKCDKTSERRADLIVQCSYEALQKSRWHVATEIATFVEKDKSANEVIILMARINSWIARKRVSDKSVILKEVTDFDVSAKDDLFKLAKHCLLEEHTVALTLAKKLEKSGQLTLGDITEWPLFEDMRATSPMALWITQLKSRVTKGIAKSVTKEKIVSKVAAKSGASVSKPDTSPKLRATKKPALKTA
jgi:hypothetical protein